MRYSTLPAALDELSKLDRVIRFIHRGGEESRIGFAELKHRALNLLHHFQDHGIRPGDEMMVVVNRNDAFLDAYWACLYGGIIPVPLAPGIADEQRRKVFRVAQTLSRPRLFTQHGLVGRLAEFAEEAGFGDTWRRLRTKTMVAEDIGAKQQVGETAAQTDPDSTAFIQFSSGSTNDPKGVVLSHRNLLVNIRDVIDTAKLKDSDRALSWMPLTHDMGLIGFHLMMLLAGMEHTIIATDAFIRRPMRWIQAASDLRANILCSPNFGYRYLLKSFSPEKAGDIDLSHVRIIFNGAEPISPNLCEEFLNTLASFGLKRTAMYPVYGLAEASLAVSFPVVETEYTSISVARESLGSGERIQTARSHNPVTLVSVGRGIGECEVRIGDDKGCDLGMDTVGRVLIRGPNVTKGYYRDGRNLNRDAFVAEDWLDTGDLGFMHAGELYITGRTKDVIFVNGQNYYAHDIEGVAADVEGLELGKVAAGGVRNPASDIDEMVLFILYRDERPGFIELAQKAARTVNERTGATVAAAVPVKHIPKTTSGKLRRFGLQEDYEKGEFQKVVVRLGPVGRTADSQSGVSAAESFLRELCTDVLDGIQIGRDDNFFDLGIGSLKMIEIHELIDERYPDCIEVTDLFDYPTLAKLAARLEGRL